MSAIINPSPSQSFNPYRVFSSAETSLLYAFPRYHDRFNPYRVFSSAETFRAPFSITHFFCFNPYRVFSSAETIISPSRQVYNNRVSIPIGFSHQLRQPGRLRDRRGREVSIPIGFSHQLRPASAGSAGPGLVRFNPYRVFSSAETSASSGKEWPERVVSIPIGFSHQLRPLRMYARVPH